VYAGIAGVGLSLLTYGVADQPATGYPAMDPGEALGYAAISNALLVTAPGGIRAEYDNALYASTIPSWPGQIMEMNTPPADVSLADWDSIKNQLYTETTDVTHVLSLFTQISYLVQQVKSDTSSALSNDAKLVELSTGGKKNSTVEWLLEAMFEAALWGVAAAGLPVGGAIAASVLASGVGSVLPELTGDPDPTSQTAITATEVQLSSLLDKIYRDSNTNDGNWEDAILSDWGRLNTIGSAIQSNALEWNYSKVPKIAGHVDKGFSKYFLQTLMPLKWQVMYFPEFDDIYPNEIDPEPYDFVEVVIGHDDYNNPVVNLWFIHDKNGAHGPYDYAGPYPTETLLMAIYNLGIQKNALVTGANGWLPINEID
jgi:hypothetical protein